MLLQLTIYWSKKEGQLLLLLYPMELNNCSNYYIRIHVGFHFDHRKEHHDFLERLSFEPLVYRLLDYIDGFLSSE